MKITEIFNSLKSFEIFKDIPDHQLLWLIDKGEVKTLEVGHSIFLPGDPIDNTLIILKGQFRLFAISGELEREIGTKVFGEVSGFLPFSRGKIASGKGKVIEEATILFLHRSYEKEMLREHYELSQALVHEMTSRVREFTNFQKQTEKMAALGKLSAGLAHELNNPASAILRSSLELKKHLRHQPEKFKKVIKIKLTDEIIDQINDLLFEKINNHSGHKTLLQRKELEDNLSHLLEDFEVESAFELAEDLADFGFEEKDLHQLASMVAKEDFGPVLHWMGDNLMIEKMVNDIQESSERISKLVKSVKVYTHMDQSPEKKRNDIHEGIINTLNILNHKIKSNNTKVIQDFDHSIPPLLLYVSEINQVWTNLIDNALDAVSEVENPKITIKTWQQNHEVKICIIDNGKGISPEIASRIWEPFFTTKSMGNGTGLGLELVLNIVERHQGNIKMKSQPGSTTFEICFPIQ
ncbi:ATP-binding protein [Aquiflexum sp.]|uniref:ATP-binding protein n=1 Tax=Aquiflexum sp. TaxID=1872584 RepID=UPI0035940838